MPYNAGMYMPYAQNYQQPMAGYQAAGYQQPAWVQPNQQPYDARVRVKGRNGAEAYGMPPNSHAVLLDENEDILYYKATDSAGYPSIMEFDLVPRNRETSPQPTAEYVTREDFNALAAKVEELTAPKPTRTRKAASDGE